MINNGVSKINLEQIKSFLTEASLENIEDIQKSILKEEKERGKLFVDALKKSNVKQLNRLLELGVSFSHNEIWNNVVCAEIKDPSKEMLDFFCDKKFNKKFLKPVRLSKISDLPTEARNFAKQLITKNFSVDPKDFLISYLISRLEKQLCYSDFKEETFWNAKEYIVEDRFNKIENRIIANFANQENLIQGYKSLHKYVREQKKSFLLFENLTEIEKIKFFIKDKEYGLELNLYKNKEELMKKAISVANLEKIKALQQLGFSLLMDKPCYSDLFLKTKEESLACQEYIITNCEDVTFGNQIILKTLLHSSIDNKKISLIEKTLERYSDENIEKIPLALKKRDVNSEVKFVMKFMEYKILKMNVAKEKVEEKVRFKL